MMNDSASSIQQLLAGGIDIDAAADEDIEYIRFGQINITSKIRSKRIFGCTNEGAGGIVLWIQEQAQLN